MATLKLTYGSATGKLSSGGDHAHSPHPVNMHRFPRITGTTSDKCGVYMTLSSPAATRGDIPVYSVYKHTAFGFEFISLLDSHSETVRKNEMKLKRNGPQNNFETVLKPFLLFQFHFAVVRTA